MFRSLRDAFREAVDNFRTELRRDQVPEAADRLLVAMKQELVQARTELARLEKKVEDTRAAAASEAEEARTCLRREEQARKVGDEETVRIAREWAAKHLRRGDLLQQKAALLAREARECRSGVDEMTERLKEATVQREALGAAAGRTGARRRLEEADDLFDSMDRMAERIDELEGRAAAAREIDEMELGTGPASPGPPPAGARPGSGADAYREAEVEARLAEMKRKLEREGG